MSHIPLPPGTILLEPEEQVILRAHYNELRALQTQADRISRVLQDIMAVIGKRATGSVDLAGYSLDVQFRGITPRSPQFTDSEPQQLPIAPV